MFSPIRFSRSALSRRWRAAAMYSRRRDLLQIDDYCSSIFRQYILLTEYRLDWIQRCRSAQLASSRYILVLDLTSITASPSALSSTVGIGSSVTYSGRGFRSGNGELRGFEERQTTYSYVTTPPFARTKPFLLLPFLNSRTIPVKACQSQQVLWKAGYTCTYMHGIIISSSSERCQSSQKCDGFRLFRYW